MTTQRDKAQRFAALHRFKQRRERQLGIADQRDFARHRLVDVERVERRVDHPLARRNGEPERGGGEAAADPEQHGALVEPFADAAVDPVAARAER